MSKIGILLEICIPWISAGKCGKFASDDLPSPPERPPAQRSIAMGQRSCAVLRVWFIIKVPGWSWKSHASELRVWRSRLRDSGRSFRDWDFANCLNRKPRFPKFLISSTRKREKVTRPAATRPLGSKDNTKGRSHSQQNDDLGVPRTRLPHATRPPETDSRTLAFSAVLRARKKKQRQTREMMPSSPTGLNSQDFSWITVRE